MRARLVGSLAVGVLLLFSPLTAQAPPLPQGTPVPGPPAPRPQTPARDGPAQPATGTGRIQGRVLSAETGAPLRRAQVRLFAGEQRINRLATTDADGRYQISDLPAGRYNINVTRNGYVSLQFGQRRPFEPGRPLELANGQLADRIDFALPRGGVIAGRITDEVGEPIAGVGVRAMRYQYMPDGRRRLMPANVPGVFNLQTNDLGEFRLYGLMPGTYIVTASPNAMGGAMMMPAGAPGGPATIVGANDGSDGFAPTYYPGTPSEADAVPITVSIGQETSASFALIPTRLARISGIVRTSQGQPAANVNLIIQSAQPGMGVGFGGSTGADGTFLMMNVPPGDYMLAVRPRPVNPGTAGAESEFASMPLTVGGEDVSNLIIVTGHGGTVSGRVIFEGGTQQSAAQEMPGPMGLRVTFLPADTNVPMMPMGAMGGIDNGAIGPNGQFQLRGVTGRGTFRISTSPQWSVKSVTLEGMDVTDTPYDIKPGANLSSLEIVITNVQSTVSGTVRTPTGEVAKDYVVVFFPANLREGDIPSRFVRAVRPDQEGKYLVRGLPPADYIAAAVDTLEQGGQWDPEFQERVKPRSRRFTLREGQTLALDLDLQP